MSAPSIGDRITHRLDWEDLDRNALGELVRLARAEDLEGWGLAHPPAATGDVTSKVIGSGKEQAQAMLVAREPLTVCGLPLVQLVLDAYGPDCRFETAHLDGDSFPAGSALGTLAGPARTLLEAERVLLNFLQKLSGVASLTRSYVDAMGATSTRLLDTRKTTPGFRVLEKYAVARGGGFNHRIGLFDRVMLKDNHLAAGRARQGAALSGLVRCARELSPGMVVELEVDRLEQVPPALEAGVDVLLLDNFDESQLRQAVKLVGNRAATEASGGINRESLPALADIGLDFISTGATVHQSTWKDIALDWND
jgi:nicotinate-nucleotide pyrophosphorylase (carboxylating)